MKRQIKFSQSDDAYLDTNIGQQGKRQKNHQKIKKAFFRGIAGTGVAVAAFSCVCIVNPAVAAQTPIIGHVFEKMGESLGFAGDYTNLAEPVKNSEAGGESMVVMERQSHFRKRIAMRLRFT